MVGKKCTPVITAALLCLTQAGSLQARSNPETAKVATEQIRIASDPGVTLAGEFLIPDVGQSRRPAVLLLGGGGPSPHGIYPAVEARLHAQGIATLSFDKRGVGTSTGSIDDAMDRPQRDAAAALAYLRSRRDVIDVNRIAILGLSQGGVIGPALAANDPPIAAVVMLAAPAGKRGVLFLDAMSRQLAAAGMSGQALGRVIGAARRYLDALTMSAIADRIAANRTELVGAFVAAGWTKDEAEGAIGMLSHSTVSSMYTVDPGAVLAKVKSPVLAIYGANDTNVPSRQTMPDARVALRANPDATVVEMPNVEHGFKPLVTTSAGKREYQGWPVSDPATVDLIDNWLSTRLLGTKGIKLARVPARAASP